jgi:hypothetical protein
VQNLKLVRTSGFDGTKTEESELRSKTRLKSKRGQSTPPMSGKKHFFIEKQQEYNESTEVTAPLHLIVGNEI